MTQPLLQLGSRGPDVAELRRLLRLHGIGVTDWDVSPSQVFDEQLRIAVRAFQASHGLKIDGVVGPQTREKLSWSDPAPGAQRHINAAGLALIERFEGCSLSVYRDPVGLPTVGVGHLLSAAEREKWPVGTKLSQAEVDALLLADLRGAEEAVGKLVKVPLGANQFAALVSFTFNCGGSALRKSTLLRKLNTGDYDGAAAGFAAWNKAGGKVLPGLTRRRAAEAALFQEKT